MTSLSTEECTLETCKWLQFSLGNEFYAVTLDSVREVSPMCKYTPVPFTPEYYCGVVNLRGEIITLIDLRIRFKLKDISLTKETSFIVLEVENRIIGAVVDSVDNVLSVASNSISSVPTINIKVSSQYIKGVTKELKGFVFLIDSAELLGSIDCENSIDDSEEKSLLITQ